MRREAEFFGEEELHLIYIARRLAEAQALEKALAERSIDFLVEPDTYTGGVIFRGTRVGAFFYTRERDLESARAAVRSTGFIPYSAEE